MELLKSITQLWLNQIDACKKKKEQQFDRTARRAWAYLGKDYKRLYVESEADEQDRFPTGGQPYYKTRLNKSAEFVALMIPYIHARVPHRLVSPRRPAMPNELKMMVPGLSEQLAATETQERMQCLLMQHVLNYTPTEYGLYREVRTALPEALVKGRGVLWAEMADGPSGKIPAHYFDSVDNLLIDADCVQMRDAGFIVRRRRMQAWKLAELYEVDVKKLRGSYSSHLKEAASSGDAEQGDVCEYFEVWSRMGIGHRLVGASDEVQAAGEILDKVGPNVFLAVMPGIDHPLNLPPEAFGVPDAMQEVMSRLEWPLAFHEDLESPWPCSVIDFLPGQDSPWPRSPLEAALPLQRFLDFAYSFLMSRVRSTCRDLFVASKQMQEAIAAGLESGLDGEIIPYDGEPGVELKNLLHVIQFPPLNADAWQVIAAVERAFEQATGMDPLLYGGQGNRQMRSAQEATIREAHLTSRPEDYADCVEQAMSAIARKEALALRLYTEPQTVAPLFGEKIQEPIGDGAALNPLMGMGPLTQLWATLVNTDDPAEAAGELTYTVEAGTGRRKNKQKQVEDAQMLVQSLLPFAAQQAGMGNVTPYNELMGVIEDAYEVPARRLQLMQVAAPPQAPPEAGPESGPENQGEPSVPNAGVSVP